MQEIDDDGFMVEQPSKISDGLATAKS